MTPASPPNAAPALHRTYADALLACSPDAYQSEELVNIVVDKTALFVDRLRTQRRFDLGALRTLIGIGLAHDGSRLRVLDFGGAAGYHHAMAQAAFGERIALRWNVVETPAMVRRAARLATGTLQFFDDLAAAKEALGSVDLLLASSSLQYCPDPLRMLDALVDVGARHLFITRTPFSDGDATLVTTQNSLLGANGPGPLPHGYTDKLVTYPVTYVPQREVEARLQRRYDIRFSVAEDPASLFAGDRPVNAYHGYFCDLR